MKPPCAEDLDARLSEPFEARPEIRVHPLVRAFGPEAFDALERERCTGCGVPIREGGVGWKCAKCAHEARVTEARERKAAKKAERTKPLTQNLGERMAAPRRVRS